MNDSTSKPGDKKPPVVRPASSNGSGLPHPKVPGTEESPTRSTGEGAPPKVNLKGAVPAPPDETVRISMAAPGQEPTERIHLTPPKTDETERIHMGAAKPPSDTDRLKPGPSDALSRTDRIDLGAAKKPGETARITVSGPAPSKDTDRIALPQKPALSDTDRIDLSSAKPHGDTARIDVSPAAEADEELTSATMDPSRLTAALGKTGARSTDRIDLAEALPAEPPPPPRQPSEAERLMAASTVPIASLETSDLLSATTIPIESITADAGVGAQGSAPEAFKNQTMRVELDADELAKGDTARIGAILPETPTTAARIPGTSRVDLAAHSDADDVFRRRAADVTGAAAAAAGVAKRPGATSKVPIPAPAELTEPPKAPSRPATARVAVEPPTKSATARIEVEASEIPHTPPRPKSIKLKRAEGAAKKAEATTSGLPTSVAARPGTESYGVLSGLAAVVSVLVMAALVYVLAAQTIATQLPFPGRM